MKPGVAKTLSKTTTMSGDIVVGDDAEHVRVKRGVSIVYGRRLTRPDAPGAMMPDVAGMAVLTMAIICRTQALKVAVASLARLSSQRTKRASGS